MERDEELLRRSRTGDVSAFGSLVERHESAVCAVSFAITGDREVAEDVAQDAFVAAWQNLASLRDPGRFKAWACGIARNLARKARKTREVQVEDARSVPDPAPNAEEQLDARAREAAVWASLESLSPTYREPLVLFYRQGRSTREVAEALGLSVATVEQRLSRGRKQLRAEVLRLVEQTLEDERPRGRISAAVVAGLSQPPVPKASSATMKALLISSAVAASIGLTAYALDAADPPSSPGASESELATAQRPQEPEPPASSRRPRHPAASAVRPTEVSGGDEPTPPTVRIARPFEIKTLGPDHVVMDLRGGLSEATGSKKGPADPIVGHIEGTVLGPKGKPLADAVILGGRYITMKFGNELSSQAGVFSGREGDFALPVFVSGEVGLLAAHHEHGMSEVTVTKTGEGRAQLRLQAFATFEGRVEEEEEHGIPARVALLGSRQPLLVFGGPTRDDGSFRFGPLPPGSYRTNTAVSSREEGASLKFPTLGVDLKPGRASKASIEALEGAALVLESRIEDPESVEWVELRVIAGRHDIGSHEQLRELGASLPEGAARTVGRSCEDEHCGDISFDGLEPGVHTACRSIRRPGGSTKLDCKVEDVGEDQLTVVRFDPQ